MQCAAGGGAILNTPRSHVAASDPIGIPERGKLTKMDPLPEKIFYIPPRLDPVRLKDVPGRLRLAQRLQVALCGWSAAFVLCQRATWRARLWWTERRPD